MAASEFQLILSEFLPKYRSLQPLAEALYQLLFPVREDYTTLWTGTVGLQDGRAMLYDKVLQSFDETGRLQKS